MTLAGKLAFILYTAFSPNLYIQVSVSDLNIPRIGPHIWLQQSRQTGPGNKKSITDI